MNFTFLLAGLGFVAIAGVLYYFTSKSEEFEEAPRKEVREEPKFVVPAYEVNSVFILLSIDFLFIFSNYYIYNIK